MVKKITAIIFIIALLVTAGCSRSGTPEKLKGKKAAGLVSVNPEDAARSTSLTDDADKIKEELFNSFSSKTVQKDLKSDDPLKEAKKKLNEAAVKYEEAIKLDPGNVRAYTGLAFIFRAKEEPEKALEVYEKGLEKLPENVDLWAFKAKTLFLQQKYEDAAVAYRKLRDLDEKDYIINRYLADCYVMLGRMEEAEKVYSDALAKFPDNVMLNEFCGSFWFNRAETVSDKQEALAMFQKCADFYETAFKNLNDNLQRTGPRLVFRQGEAYFNKWKISGSKEDREKSIQLFTSYKKLDNRHIYSYSADQMIGEMKMKTKARKTD